MTTLQQSMSLSQSSGEMEELLPLVKQLTDPDQVRDIAVKPRSLTCISSRFAVPLLIKMIFFREKLYY
jgi:hypothetical protein